MHRWLFFNELIYLKISLFFSTRWCVILGRQWPWKFGSCWTWDEKTSSHLSGGWDKVHWYDARQRTTLLFYWKRRVSSVKRSFPTIQGFEWKLIIFCVLNIGVNGSGMRNKVIYPANYESSQYTVYVLVFYSYIFSINIITKLPKRYGAGLVGNVYDLVYYDRGE